MSLGDINIAVEISDVCVFKCVSVHICVHKHELVRFYREQSGFTGYVANVDHKMDKGQMLENIF